MAKDIRSTAAKNLRLLEIETEGLTWTSSKTKVMGKLLQNKPRIPEQDQWRIQYLGHLLEQRDQMKYAGQEDDVQVEWVQNLIDSLCTS